VRILEGEVYGKEDGILDERIGGGVGAVDGVLRRRKHMGRGEDGEEERRGGFMYGLWSAVKAMRCGSEIKTEMKTEIKIETKTEIEMVCADMI
jgi:hypothetical protein